MSQVDKKVRKITAWPVAPTADSNGLFETPLYLCSPGKRCMIGGIKFFYHLKRQYPTLGTGVWLEK